jgi:hypothetical protein
MMWMFSMCASALTRRGTGEIHGLVCQAAVPKITNDEVAQSNCTLLFAHLPQHFL